MVPSIFYHMISSSFSRVCIRICLGILDQYPNVLPQHRTKYSSTHILTSHNHSQNTTLQFDKGHIYIALCERAFNVKTLETSQTANVNILNKEEKHLKNKLLLVVPATTHGNLQLLM